jgi:hypothetical protein
MASAVVQDCFGNMYRRMFVAGNGFCGFNSLSLCPTGTESNYVSIIDDCINVFHQRPEFFYERTNFGGGLQGTRTVLDYEAFMKDAV